jgi:hypothetical protein
MEQPLNPAGLLDGGQQNDDIDRKARRQGRRALQVAAARPRCYSTTQSYKALYDNYQFKWQFKQAWHYKSTVG